MIDNHAPVPPDTYVKSLDRTVVTEPVEPLVEHPLKLPNISLYFVSVYACVIPTKKIVLDENPVLNELSVQYVPQIGFLTAMDKRFSDLAPPDFSFAFAQVLPS